MNKYMLSVYKILLMVLEKDEQDCFVKKLRMSGLIVFWRVAF